MRGPTLMPSRFFDGPAGRLHVDDGGPEGSALPVLLVHGLGGNGGQWAAQLRHLRRTRRAAALDLRGHGQSELRPGAPLSILALADDVVATADALGLERFALVGFSIGGSIAGSVAGRIPGRVASLFLVDPASAFSLRPASDKAAIAALVAPPYASLRAAVLEALEGAKPAVRARVAADLEAMPVEVLAAVLGSLPFYDATAPLERYLRHGPVLIALASAQRDDRWRLSAQLPAIKEHVVDGTSHWLMMDAPDKLQPLLEEFFGRVERS